MGDPVAVTVTPSGNEGFVLPPGTLPKNVTSPGECGVPAWRPYIIWRKGLKIGCLLNKKLLPVLKE